MKSRNVLALFAMFGLAAITGGLWHNTVHAGPILYEQTILTGAVANADPNFPFANCIASEGCMGKPGLSYRPG